MNNIHKFFLYVLIVMQIITFFSVTGLAQDKKDSALLFVGTFTSASDMKSVGIYVYQMNTATGALSFTGITANTDEPTYLVLHPNKKWLYAVNELNSHNDNYTGALSAFQIDLQKKQLGFINKVSSHGNSPCYIAVDKTGKYVMTANYGNGSIALYRINNDGTLGEATSVIQHQGKGPVVDRQEGPHAHMITQGADKKFVYAVDLGCDKVMVYQLDTVQGKLIATNHNVSTRPGAGPRHLVFHPNQQWAYLVHELDGFIEAFTIDKSTGALTVFQTISNLPEGIKLEPASADIHITPNGLYLYATNRANVNNIGMYSIDQKSGMLRLLGHVPTHGKTPRNFVIDPSGKFVLVANQNSNNIITFRIDQSSGKLIETGIETSVPHPGCLKFWE
jgi:6-phosphogluconolactonase